MGSFPELLGRTLNARDLWCGGRAQRQQRLGSSPVRCGVANHMPIRSPESKAVWRFASRRTP